MPNDDMPKREKPRWYLRIDKNFVNRLEIRKLERISPSAAWAYLKLCISSLNDNCRLIYHGLEDSPAEEWALAINTNVDDVQTVIDVLTKCDLLLTHDGKVFELIPAVEFSKSESASAQRVRAFRDRNKTDIDDCNDDVTECNATVTPSNDDVTTINSYSYNNSYNQNNINKTVSSYTVNSYSQPNSYNNSSVNSTVTRFTPPTIQEVTNYFEQTNSLKEGFNIKDESQRFIDVNSSYHWAQARRNNDWKSLADKFVTQAIVYQKQQAEKGQRQEEPPEDDNPLKWAPWYGSDQYGGYKYFPKTGVYKYDDGRTAHYIDGKMVFDNPPPEPEPEPEPDNSDSDYYDDTDEIPF